MTFLAFLGGHELLIVLAIFVLLFGARKLPELARSMGTSITQFKKGLKDDRAELDEKPLLDEKAERRPIKEHD